MPNIAAKWLALLRVWEVPVHTSVRTAAILTEVLAVFTVTQGKCPRGILNYITTAFCRIICNLIFINIPIIRRYGPEFRDTA